MPWWGWIAIGTLMLAAELSWVDADFYLVFLGVSALVVGSLELSGMALAWWAQWLFFAGLAVGSLFFFRQRVYVLFRPPPGDEIPEGIDGETAVASSTIAPGATGRVELRGSGWTAVNEGDRAIEAGARCDVVGRKGLTIRVRSAE